MDLADAGAFITKSAAISTSYCKYDRAWSISAPSQGEQLPVQAIGTVDKVTNGTGCKTIETTNAVRESLRRSEEQGVVMERRVQQVLHYTHDFVQKAQAQTEANLQHVYQAHVQAQSHAHESQLAQIQRAICSAENNANSMHQASIREAMRVVAEESAIRAQDVARAFVQESSAAYEEKLYSQIAQSQKHLEQVSRDHTMESANSLKEHVAQ
ncbi:hypothetical protein PHYPSEUDO_013184 [Phytophthora pseudosyringae]|uniref:Uncharacterized protein n=1 Tax=Phytophthora pseudosyringae TaxID=221518 RepID=A0A8T1W3U3_9STRA|nr:hypothetical protein PHYPSEUDO_013184 [Phytophthora pseudosyringae]